MITEQSATLEHLIAGYQLCAATEGKSPSAIAIVTSSVSYFQDFLVSEGRSKDVTQISQHEIWFDAILELLVCYLMALEGSRVIELQNRRSRVRILPLLPV